MDYREERSLTPRKRKQSLIHNLFFSCLNCVTASAFEKRKLRERHQFNLHNLLTDLREIIQLPLVLKSLFKVLHITNLTWNGHTLCYFQNEIINLLESLSNYSTPLRMEVS